MSAYILKRMGMMIITLLLIAVLVFFLMHAIPGGPFTAERELPPEVEAALVEKYNLDASLLEQLIDYIGGLLRGDLGPSFKYPGMRVNDFIREGFPVSAKLGLITILFVLAASIPLGIVAALRNGKWQDVLTMLLATIGVTIPSFVIAAFGKLIKGFDVLDSIANAETASPELENRPIEPQVIESIRVI